MQREIRVNKTVKIAVTGAAGQIGYALLFRIASGDMFGKDVAIQLSLLELESAMVALSGVKMELEDCAFPLLRNVQMHSEPEKAFADADWVILVGSVPRKAGMERGDLLKINANVFIRQGQALGRNAKKTCQVLVVGNPCNANAYITKESAKGINPKNFFAMTMLDQNRAVAQIALKSGVSIESIERLAIWGNHSATQFPDFFNARINDQPLMNIINDENWLKGEFIQTIQKRGAEIIKMRGTSSAASAANAIVDTVKALLTPTRPGQFFSAATVSDGSYGIPEGVVFGYPLTFDGKEVVITQGIEHNDFSKEMLKTTLKELEEEINIVNKMM